MCLVHLDGGTSLRQSRQQQQQQQENKEQAKRKHHWFEDMQIPAGTVIVLGLIMALPNVVGQTTVTSNPCLLMTFNITISDDAAVGSCVPAISSPDCLQWTTENRIAEFSLREEHNIFSNGSQDQPVICVQKSLATYKGIWPATLEAMRDNDLVITIRLEIVVMELNDPPRFDPPEIRAVVQENAAPGPLGVLIHVIDPDDQVHTKLRVVSDDIPKNLKLEAVNETFYTIILTGQLDFEVYNHITFHVNATDPGGLSARANVTLVILDVNDNVPVCQANTTIEMMRYSEPGASVLDVRSYCTDMDETSITNVYLKSEGDCTGVFVLKRLGLVLSESFFPTFERNPGDSFLTTGVNILTINIPCHVELIVGDGVHNTTWPVTITFHGCLAGQDDRGTFWGPGNPGQQSSSQCPAGYTGQITRFCSQDQVYQTPVYRCTSLFISELQNKPRTTEATVETVETLATLTSVQNKSLQEGDIITSVSILSDVTSTVATTNTTFVANISAVFELTNAFFDVASNLIDTKNEASWQSLVRTNDGGAQDVFAAIDTYALVLSGKISNLTSKVQVSKENLVMELDVCTHDIQFPNRASTIPTWARTSKNEIDLKCSAAGVGARYTSAYYKNVSAMMPLTLAQERNSTQNVSINAAVMSFSLIDEPTKNLTSPIEITFQYFDAKLTSPMCSFWSYSARNGSGAWSMDGCSLKQVTTDTATCSCNHLTNFALLMSPSSGELPPTHVTALSVISAVGCGISMVALVATIILHIIYWKLVKSDRAIILLHLCGTLLVAYIIFLTGVNRTENQGLCTAIAVLMHYIFLVVFFLMLAEGLNLALSILFVYMSLNKKYGKWLIIMSWAAPVVIVGISMAATQLQGYGSSTSCWLSVDSGLIWAFIVPVLVIIVLNVVIIVLVIRKMFQTAAIKNKSDREKAKTGARSICVLLPIMGTTWVIGVFSVNENLVAFQYAFAILNSLQGLFIFILHGLLNKKINEAIIQAWRKRRGYKHGQETFTKTQTKSTASSQV